MHGPESGVWYLNGLCNMKVFLRHHNAVSVSIVVF